MVIAEKHYKLTNTEIYLQQVGTSKEAILLIHGFLGSTFTWRFLLPLLGVKHTVYAIDLPGFGHSDKSKTYPYSIQSFTHSIYDFIKAEHIRQLTVIAHSMGGQVAMRLAAHAPEIVERLILIAPSSYLPAAKRWQKALCAIPLSYHIVPYMLTQKRIQRELKSVVFNFETVDTKALYDGYVPPLKDRAFPRVLFKFVRARENDLSSEELKNVKQPTLLLWGRHDRVVPLPIGYRLKQDLPHAELMIIEETGHLPMEEKPEYVMEQIRPFLKHTL